MKRTKTTTRIARLWNEAGVRTGGFDPTVPGSVPGSRFFDPHHYGETRDMLQGVADAFTSSDGRAYRVTFNKDAGIARSDPRERVIEVSPEPLTDRSLSEDDARHVMTAYLAHECTHDRYWRNYGKALDVAFGDKGALRERAHVYDNVLQDVVGERRFEADYPGFKGIFEPVIEYVATKYPHKPMRDDRPINRAIAAIRYAPWRDWSGVEDERDWWADWRDRWTTKPTPARFVDAIREAILHEQEQLEDQDQQQAGSGTPGDGTPGDGQGQGGGEGDGQGGGQGQGDKGGDGKSDASGDADGGDAGGSGGAPKTSESANESGRGGKGASTGKTDLPKNPHPDMAVAPDVTPCNTSMVDANTDPDQRANAETAADVNGEYVERPDRSAWPKTPVVPDGRITAAVAAAFRRSRTGTTGYERGYRSGMLDNRSLDRLASGDGHVFGRRISPEPGKYSVYVMVDVSGSMFAPARPMPIDAATQVAAAVANASRSLSGLRLSLFGWASGPVCHIWRTGEPMPWIGGFRDAAHTVCGGGTRDAAAMRWAIKNIRKTLMPGEQPIIIMLSDGEGQTRQLADAVAEGRKAGITIIGMAIGQGLDLTSVYGKNTVPWQGSVSDAAMPLATIISRAMNPIYSR